MSKILWVSLCDVIVVVQITFVGEYPTLTLKSCQTEAKVAAFDVSRMHAEILRSSGAEQPLQDHSRQEPYG